MPKVDGTDWYMFRSYETGRSDFVTMVANYYPLQDPFGGPNYFLLDPAARYEMKIDNDGDAKPDIIFRFQFTNTRKDLTLPINGKNVAVPLTNIGPIPGMPGNLNVVETYTVKVIRPGHAARIHHQRQRRIQGLHQAHRQYRLQVFRRRRLGNELPQ